MLRNQRLAPLPKGEYEGLGAHSAALVNALLEWLLWRRAFDVSNDGLWVDLRLSTRLAPIRWRPAAVHLLALAVRPPRAWA
jgi:hypothetical protein